MTAKELHEILRGYRFNYSNEQELQEGIAAMFLRCAARRRRPQRA